MAPVDIGNEILQILASPAWSGAWTSIGVAISTTISIIALKKSREPDTPPAPRLAFKKISEFSTFVQNISF